MISELLLAAVSPAPRVSAPRTTTTRTAPTSSLRSINKSTTTYQGKSYSYNQASSYYQTNSALWLVVLVAALNNQPPDVVRDTYEDQLSNLRASMKKHDKLPTYEESVDRFNTAFRGHDISSQEIGSTLYNEYSKVGPQPKEKLQ